MSEILSQDEISALLSAISSKEVNEESYSADPIDGRKVRLYDFRRPEKFSKDQVRALQIIHETFSRLASTMLSAYLHSVVTIHVDSVDQLTCEDFVRSIPNPTTLAVINMDPLRGSAIIEIDSSITFAIIDRLFGGKGDPIEDVRELSDIESSVIEGIIIRILGNLREAWLNVIDLRPRLDTIETNPQFTQIAPPSDMVFLIGFEIKVGDVEGVLNFCIPYITIQPIVFKLTAQYWYPSMMRGDNNKKDALDKDRINNIQVPVKAEVGSTELSVSQVKKIKVGDVIRLKNLADSHLSLSIGSKKKLSCKLGKIGKNVAIQVDVKSKDAIEKPSSEEINSGKSSKIYFSS